jgi:hypothetical protein
MPKATNPNRAKPSRRTGRYVLVGSTMRKVSPGIVLCRSADLSTLVQAGSKKTVFVSSNQNATENLLKAGLAFSHGGGRMGELLTLEPPRRESVPPLFGLFDRVIGASSGYSWLPVKELMTVVSEQDASDRFIGGAADRQSETLALVRGNLATIVVPFAYFVESGDGTKPDFGNPSFADYGLTVALGAYEASSDGILYEFDPVYRQKLNKERRQNERTFGAALRRLRLQRGLKQGDFIPLTAKTIARIERSEVGKPHGKTLQIIAQRLGVNADQIESY